MENRKNQQYMYGNTARQLEYLPEYEERTRRNSNPKTSVNAQIKTKKNSVIDARFAVFLTAAIVVTLYSCVSYLQLQSTVSSQRDNISTMQAELSDLKDENVATAERLNSSVDLNAIYNTATKELGMVYANDNQVVEYEPSNPDYVRQYKDIPEASK